MIQRYLKGKIEKDKFLTIQIIQKKLEMDKILGDMKEIQIAAMKLYVAKWTQGRWRIYKAQLILKELKRLKAAELLEIKKSKDLG